MLSFNKESQMQWNTFVLPATWEECLSPEVWDQPRQHKQDPLSKEEEKKKYMQKYIHF
jgi:hypothetical protein